MSESLKDNHLSHTLNSAKETITDQRTLIKLQINSLNYK